MALVTHRSLLDPKSMSVFDECLAEQMNDAAVALQSVFNGITGQHDTTIGQAYISTVCQLLNVQPPSVRGGCSSTKRNKSKSKSKSKSKRVSKSKSKTLKSKTLKSKSKTKRGMTGGSNSYHRIVFSAVMNIVFGIFLIGIAFYALHYYFIEHTQVTNALEMSIGVIKTVANQSAQTKSSIEFTYQLLSGAVFKNLDAQTASIISTIRSNMANTALRVLDQSISACDIIDKSAYANVGTSIMSNLPFKNSCVAQIIQDWVPDVLVNAVRAVQGTIARDAYTECLIDSSINEAKFELAKAIHSINKLKLRSTNISKMVYIFTTLGSAMITNGIRKLTSNTQQKNQQNQQNQQKQNQKQIVPAASSPPKSVNS